MSKETNFGTHDTNRELIVDALRASSTVWQLWSDTKYTATVREPITIEAATLRGQRSPVVVTTGRPDATASAAKMTRWAYDGDVMVRLPEPDPQSGEYVRGPEGTTEVLRGPKCPTSVTIGGRLSGEPSGDPVIGVTFGGDLVRETGVWEPRADAFTPEGVTERNTPSPLDSIGIIVDYVRERSGLPPNGSQISAPDAVNAYGLN